MSLVVLIKNSKKNTPYTALSYIYELHTQNRRKRKIGSKNYHIFVFLSLKKKSNFFVVQKKTDL